MSLCYFGVEGNDEAARVRSGSDSEMVSDINWFVSCSALCVRALVKLDDNGYFHVA